MTLNHFNGKVCLFLEFCHCFDYLVTARTSVVQFPILSVIILVIKQIGLPLSGNPVYRLYDYRPNWTPLMVLLPLFIIT